MLQEFYGPFAFAQQLCDFCRRWLLSEECDSEKVLDFVVLEQLFAFCHISAYKATHLSLFPFLHHALASKPLSCTKIHCKPPDSPPPISLKLLPAILNLLYLYRWD